MKTRDFNDTVVNRAKSDQEFKQEFKKTLLEYFIENTEHEIEPQELDDGTVQIAAWMKSFDKNWSIFYQGSDMNGETVNSPYFNNDGVNYCGLLDCRNILKEIPGFNALIDDETYCKYGELDEFIGEFCADFAEKYKINEMF